MQGREGTGEKKDIGDSSGRLVDAGTSFSLQEGPLVRKKACGMHCLGFFKHTVKIFDALRICSVEELCNSLTLFVIMLHFFKFKM